MKKILFKKVIRDKLYQKFLEENVKVDKINLDNASKKQKLKEKLIEEVQEVIEATTKQELTEELADLLEVIYTIAQKSGISKQELASAQKEKREQKGGFQECIYIESITISEHHTKLNYFLSRPKKYPQL